MESVDQIIKTSLERAKYQFNFENGIIHINYFQNHFTFVDIKDNIRWKIPLSAFDFKKDNWNEMNDKYQADSSQGYIEIFKKEEFLPLDEFIDLDQILHIAPHYVYLIRGYLSTKSNQNNLRVLEGRNWAKIYKFDFSKLEYRQIFAFKDDVYHTSIVRFDFREDQTIELMQAYNK